MHTYDATGLIGENKYS